MTDSSLEFSDLCLTLRLQNLEIAVYALACSRVTVHSLH